MEKYIIETLLFLLIILALGVAAQCTISVMSYIRLEQNHKKTLEWLDALAHLTEDLNKSKPE